MTEPGAIRIGDVERDQAISGLGDHFAAGRLTRMEYDDRAEQALLARFRDDLVPLFADLPRITTLPSPVPGPLRTRQRPDLQTPRPPLALMLLPMVVVAGVVMAMAFGAPWLVFGLFWLFMFSGFGSRRQHHHGAR